GEQGAEEVVPQPGGRLDGDVEREDGERGDGPHPVERVQVSGDRGERHAPGRQALARAEDLHRNGGVRRHGTITGGLTRGPDLTLVRPRARTCFGHFSASLVT